MNLTPALASPQACTPAADRSPAARHAHPVVGQPSGHPANHPASHPSSHPANHPADRLSALRRAATGGLRRLAAHGLMALGLACMPWWAQAAVDANRASQAELESVRGIGPGLSTKILAARQTKPFADWPDMVQRVVGVGARNAARLSDAGLTVAGASYAAGAADAAAPSKGKSSRAAAKAAVKDAGAAPAAPVPAR